jgi:peptide deformylase
MAVLPVRLYGDPVLRRVARPVEAVTPEIDRLLGDMVETMYDEVGIGLAATQVGIELRMLVVDEGRGVARAYLNPVIVERGGEAVGEEGCLSLPGIFADVTRAAWVVVEARERDGTAFRKRASGLLARVLQHEMDHLDGVLFIDRLDKATRDRIKRRIRREGFPTDVPVGAGAL